MRPVLKSNSRAVDVVLRLSDLAVLAVAFPVAYFLRDGVLRRAFSGLYPIDHYWPMVALAMLLWIGAATVSDVYVAYRRQTTWLELARIARSQAVVALGLGALAFFSHKQEVSRLFVGLYSATAMALFVVNRAVIRGLAHALRRRGYNTRRFAVAGSGLLARQAVEGVLGHPEWGYDFAGYLLESPASHAAAPGPVLGQVRDLGRILEREVVDELVVALPAEQGELTREVLRVGEERGIPVKLCMDFSVLRISRMSFEDIDGIPAVAFSPVPSDVVALGAKRLFDLALSTTVLLLTAPLLALIAAAIRLESPGPVLFRQRRVGVNGRHFTLWKFRTMCADAEARLAQLRTQNEVGGPVFKMRNDPRITRVGRWLRKTSLDEFPQFWNVLCGDMSVVGPRPPIPSEVERYEAWQRRRLSVKPGITCVWQVSGRSDIDFDEWMELDLHYIDNWSLWGDVRIVLRTVPAVLFGRGAH